MQRARVSASTWSRGTTPAVARLGVTIGSPTTIATRPKRGIVDPMAAQDLLGAGDPDRHDRHAGPQREVRGTRLQRLRSSGRSGACPSGYTQQHLAAPASIAIESRTRLAVGAVARDREAAERTEERSPSTGTRNSDALPMKRMRRVVTATPRTGCPSSSGATARARSRPSPGACLAPVDPRPGTAAAEPPATIERTMPVEEHQRASAARARSTTRPTTSSTSSVRRVDHDRVVGRPQRRDRAARCRSRRAGRARPAPRRRATAAPAAASSRWRRRARSSSLAVRNTLTGASGNTTVPMSRPFHHAAAVLARPTRAGARRAPSRTVGMGRDRRHRGRDLGPADLGAHVAAVERGDAVARP